MLVRQELPATPPAVVIPSPKPLADLQPLKPQSVLVAGDTVFDVVTEEEFVKREAERRRLGRLAQDIALRAERKRLRDAGHPNPVEAVKPVWDEPARGYDILSCELNGTPRRIEVKAARQSGKRLSFILTKNEWERSQSLPNYHFYLVLNAKSRRPDVRDVEGGEVHANCLAPVNYLASFRAPRG